MLMQSTWKAKWAEGEDAAQVIILKYQEAHGAISIGGEEVLGLGLGMEGDREVLHCRVIEVSFRLSHHFMNEGEGEGAAQI
ncbi:hypothetical protein COCNU_05G010180 [Cocos nucifera]|uniref:Uncharacterized protein n=1 Tax=Cocos nucifera TaxID=13894 RepID=A0A8K0IA25_COCNU|nr:hypothetical protein COCNU_05G010180 [Cocos nucifera]